MFYKAKGIRTDRPSCVGQEKRIVGIIASYVNASGRRVVVCWGQDKLRHDLDKKVYNPEPLSPYWAKMHDYIFKKWR